MSSNDTSTLAQKENNDLKAYLDYAHLIWNEPHLRDLPDYGQVPVDAFAFKLQANYERGWHYVPTDLNEYLRSVPLAGTTIKPHKYYKLKTLKGWLNYIAGFKLRFREMLESNELLAMRLGSEVEDDKTERPLPMSRECYFSVKYPDIITCFSLTTWQGNNEEPNMPDLLVMVMKPAGTAIDDNVFWVYKAEELLASAIFGSFLNPGDLVVLESEEDDFQLNLIEKVGARVCFTGANDEGMILSKLEEQCRTEKVKLVVLPRQRIGRSHLLLSSSNYNYLNDLSRKYNFAFIEMGL